MKEIVKVLLQEGIGEETIHEVLNILEVSDKFKTNKIEDVDKSLNNYENTINGLEGSNCPKSVVDDLKKDYLKKKHKFNTQCDRIQNKQIEKIKREENKGND